MKNELQTNQALSAVELRSRVRTFGLLLALGLGITLIVSGLAGADTRFSVSGFLVVALAGGSWVWLHCRAETEPPGNALDVFTQAEPPDEARARELFALLEAWESLEAKRGTPEFDPWALQTLRNDIRKTVESDPALSRLFVELQRAA